MVGDPNMDEREFERYRQQVSESVDGGGCAETWETLSEQRTQTGEATETSGDDIENTLLEVDCLKYTADGEDLTLTPSFRRVWQSAIDNLDEAHLEPEIAGVFGADGAIEIEETDRAVHVRHEGRLFAQWVSSPAMIADLAACHVFEQRDEDWGERSAAERSQFAGSARLYLDFCPDCGGVASFDTDVVSSCCNDYEVATVSCEACDVTLFEMPVTASPT